MSGEFDRIVADDYTDLERAQAEVGAFIAFTLENPGEPPPFVPSFEALSMFPRVALGPFGLAL